MSFVDQFKFSLAGGADIETLCAEVDGWRCFFHTNDSKHEGWIWSIETGGGYGGYRDTTQDVVIHATGKAYSLRQAAEQCWEWMQDNHTTLASDN